MTASSVLQPPFYIVGPTGSGKSRLAVALAERIGGEIINADPYQLYRGLEICTAQPSPEDRARVPHHLYGVLELSAITTAQEYANMARATIAAVAGRGRIPLVVGGSGLYIKSLTHGLSDLPSDNNLREKLAQLPAEERIRQLLEKDPAAAGSIDMRNDRYVTRALEICLLTGRPQSELRNEWAKAAPPYDGIFLSWERATIIERIHLRVLQMVEAGLVKEIASLPPLSVTAEKAIGVRQIRRHLSGELPLEEAITLIQFATRQYARHQTIWYKRELGFERIPFTPATCVEDVISLIEEKFSRFQGAIQGGR